MKKNLILLISFLLLANCSGIKNNTPIFLGGTTAGMTCAEVVNDPAILAACAVVGGVLGANAVWNDDFNVHKSYFVDHLIGAPNKTSITNWYNPKTKNSGIIRTNRTWYKGPIKCRQWSSTIDITPSWPFNWVGSSPIRKVNFGTACIMPDGRVEIQK